MTETHFIRLERLEDDKNKVRIKLVWNDTFRDHRILLLPQWLKLRYVHDSKTITCYPQCGGSDVCLHRDSRSHGSFWRSQWDFSETSVRLEWDLTLASYRYVPVIIVFTCCTTVFPSHLKEKHVQKRTNTHQGSPMSDSGGRNKSVVTCSRRPILFERHVCMRAIRWRGEEYWQSLLTCRMQVRVEGS